MPSTAGIQATRDYAEGYLAEDAPLLAARARAKELGCAPIGPGGGAALRFLARVIAARASALPRPVSTPSEATAQPPATLIRCSGAR